MSDKISSEDLISREWLKDAFDNLCCHNCKICRNFRNEDSFYKCALIENARAVERPKGNWKGRRYYRPSTNQYVCETSLCSECGEEYSYDAETGISITDYSFCPNCGARMRGNKE